MPKNSKIKPKEVRSLIMFVSIFFLKLNRKLLKNPSLLNTIFFMSRRCHLSLEDYLGHLMVHFFLCLLVLTNYHPLQSLSTLLMCCLEKIFQGKITFTSVFIFVICFS